MAASSSSSFSSSSGGCMMMTPPSSSGRPCKYDVFLSFRGEDTRKIFVGHLYRALQQKTINTFIDSEELSKGNNISELLTAIEDSKISIVVLSQNYASSTWCLKELAKISECMDTKKQIVLPIFYEVDPSDVRNIKGKFGKAFSKHGKNSDLDREELERWRYALARVADLSGWDSRKYETCSALHNLPEKIGDLKSLARLYTLESGIKNFPLSILRLNKQLEIFSFDGCRDTVAPFSSWSSLIKFYGFSCLVHLDLNDCNLMVLPDGIADLFSLRTLKLCRNNLESLPVTMDRLGCLARLELEGCKRLKSIPELSSVIYLDLSDCNLMVLPDGIADLSSLRTLKLCRNNLESLPVTMDRLGCLARLELEGRKRLKSIPELSSIIHLDLSDCNLMVLPDGIADLSSLKTLKLCRNNLESLPVTMDRLGCLAYLELEACKRLKSIPELSRIIHIDAHCCTALETISTPKTDGRSIDFRFSNCLRLPQTIFRDIVETHSLDQDNHLRFNMCLPGSEVPEWFNIRDTGCSLSLHVPPDSFNNKFLGFAICIAINFSGDRHDVSNIYARCSFTSRGNHCEDFIRFDVLRQSGTQRFLESDHLFMAYIPWFACGWITEDGFDAFEIVVETGTYSPTEDCCTNSFGVRLVYANHEEMQNSVAETIIHVDGQSIEGGVTGLGEPFFPDQLEIRKSDTEWEAESSQSGEGRGTCQTLELLPEPQTESEEEGEITVVVEQGEDCRVLGSISKLGSHSGLLVPASQDEGKDEEEMMGEECLAVRRLLGSLSSCFYWLGYLWHPRIRHRKIEVAEAEDSVVS